VANITEESNVIEALIKAAELQDKVKVLTPRVCDIDDTECEACGS